MNRVLYTLILCLGWGWTGAGQNLVPNPSFEQLTACPVNGVSVPYSPTYSNFPYLPAWVAATEWGTPDFRHICGSSVCSVPLSTLNFQYPRTGNGFAGFAANPGVQPSSSFSREYPECRLLQPLQAGHFYHMSFYCSPGEFPAFPLYTVVAVDRIGGVLTTSQIALPGIITPPLAYVPAVASPTGLPVTDTLNWTRVAGTFQAAGGEEWLTMGRFNDGIPVTTALIRQGTNPFYSCYFVVDDISIRDLAYPDSVHSHTMHFPCPSAFPVTLSGRPGGDEYTWSTTAATATIQAPGPGTYWVRTWRDSFYLADTFHITATTPPVMHLPPDTNVCSGLPLTIGANVPMSTYSWSTGAATPTITVNQSGKYILTATDSCGTQKDTIRVFYSPELRLPADTLICNNASVTVGANASYPVYQWSNGANTQSIVVTQSGLYILTVTDACGPQKDTVSVTILPAVPPPAARDTTLCKGIPGPELAVTGDSLRWYVPPSNSGSFSQPAINTAVTGTQTIYVTQTRGGCESAKQALRIDITTKPSVSLGNDTTLCDSTALLLGPPVPAGTSVQWNTGESFSPIVVRKAGYYRVTLTNVCGSALDDKGILYRTCDTPGTPGHGLQLGCLYIPTAFTPNGDGINDRFTIKPVCPLRRFRLQIRNRLGQLVFESNSAGSTWDGTFKGMPAGTDTYFYFLEVLKEGTGNVADKVKGDLLLVR